MGQSAGNPLVVEKVVDGMRWHGSCLPNGGQIAIKSLN